MCGGSLIDEETVLTVGHCVAQTLDFYNEKTRKSEPANCDRVVAFLGMNDISNITPDSLVKLPATKQTVKRIIRVRTFFYLILINFIQIK